MRFYDLAVFQAGATTTSPPVLHYTSHPQVGKTPAQNIPVYTQGQLNQDNQTPVGYTSARNTAVSNVASTPNTGSPIYKPDPGALNIIFDAMVATQGTDASAYWGSSTGGSTVTIEGLPPTLLTQAYSLSGMQIVLKGGMGAGLPLANPKQAGVLLSGTINQAFGNWRGTELSLDLIVTGGPVATGNFSFNWPAGTYLGTAIQSVLAQNFPGVKIVVNVEPDAITTTVQAGHYGTLREFAGFIRGLTEGQIISDYYPGITIHWNKGVLWVFDGSAPPTNTQLVFTDLVGQPTWIANNQCVVPLVMRGDLQTGQTITFPPDIQSLPGFATTTSASTFGMAKMQSSFQGQWVIVAMRHTGNFRSPRADTDWTTTLIVSPASLYTASAAAS
jgi:hypothetical protein